MTIHKNVKELYEKSVFGRYLLKRSESVYSFSLRSRLSHNTVYKAMLGDPIHKRTAKKITRHCQNEVKIEDFQLSHR
jgi:hypothetical protein